MVIGGYTTGTKTLDAVVFGYYEGDKLTGSSHLN